MIEFVHKQGGAVALRSDRLTKCEKFHFSSEEFLRKMEPSAVARVSWPAATTDDHSG